MYHFRFHFTNFFHHSASISLIFININIILINPASISTIFFHQHLFHFSSTFSSIPFPFSQHFFIAPASIFNHFRLQFIHIFSSFPLPFQQYFSLISLPFQQ